MKKLLLLIPTFLITLQGFPQQLEIIDSHTRALEVTLDLAKGEIQPQTEAPASGELISNLAAYIKHGEIYLEYELAALRDEDQYYEVIPEFHVNGGRLRLFAYDELEGDWGQPITSGPHQIIWLNPLDRYVNIVGEMKIILKVNLWGIRILPYDCSLGIPTFDSSQRLPYYVVAGVSAGGIALGQLFRKQRDDIYNNEYLTALTLAEAQPKYDAANSKHHSYLILTYAGSAVLATDVLLYLIRQGRFKKNLKLYNDSCKNQPISFAPLVRFPGQGQPTSMTGIQVRFSF